MKLPWHSTPPIPDAVVLESFYLRAPEDYEPPTDADDVNIIATATAAAQALGFRVDIKVDEENNALRIVARRPPPEP